MIGSSIQQARNALSILLKALDQGTRFNIVRFGSTYETLFKSSREYSKETLEDALSWLSQVDADLGGTEIFKPLASILEGDSGRGEKVDVVILTDGEVGNEAQILELVQQQASRARIFPIGIGHGPNEYFIRQLARSSHGASDMIAPGERIEARTLRLFRKLRGLSVEKISIGVKGGGKQAPEKVTLFTGETRTIFVRLRGEDTQETVRVQGRIGDSDWDVQIPVSRIEDGKSLIATLWARERIRELEEDPDIAGRGSRQTARKVAQIRNQIIDLSKEFGLVSRYASFVAVEERSGEELTHDEAQVRKVPVMVTAGWHGLDHRFGGVGMPMTAQQSFAGSGNVLQCISFDALMEASPMPERSEREAPRGPSQTFLQKLVYRKQPAERRAGGFAPDLLHSILAQQRAEGGLSFECSWTDPFGIDEDELLRSTARNSTGEVDWQILIPTALALAILEEHFAERREEWEAVVEKSRRWLRQQIVSAQPTVDGTPLEEWAADYVKSFPHSL
ncbi:MAG: VWA domain-containing protein [Acidobacteriota bacterium]|nr:MAG: VWA domain-containing protein [Acidobacteriota bacterium]